MQNRNSPGSQGRPFIVGITGGIGSGKSTVERRFAARGVDIVDTDRIAHELTAPGGAAIDAIRAAFGDEVIAADGRLDRDAMRARVFADPTARSRLEAILHPMIFWLVSFLANMLVFLTLIAMTYAVSFFGFPWPF